MKIALRTVPAYELVIGGKPILFSLSSEWRGLAELVSPEHGAMIVAFDDSLVAQLQRAFDAIQADPPRPHVTVIKASPALIALLNKDQAA